jgi:hypothetical protein
MFVYKRRDIIGRQVVFALLADDGKPNRFNQLGRLHTSWAAFHTREAGKAGPKRFGFHQLGNIALFYHGNKLMRMNVHFVKRGAGAGTFAAFHALSGIDAADSMETLGHFCFCQLHE